MGQTNELLDGDTYGCHLPNMIERFVLGS